MQRRRIDRDISKLFFIENSQVYTQRLVMAARFKMHNSEGTFEIIGATYYTYRY